MKSNFLITIFSLLFAITVESQSALVLGESTVIGTNISNEFQAEECLLFGSYVRTQYPGYTGRGYIDLADRTGSYLECVFRRDADASDTVTIYYAYGGSSRSLSVSLNDVVISSLSFPGTGSWTNWSTVKTIIPMVSGINRIRFTSTTNGSNPNIDKIFVGGSEALPMYKLELESSGAGTVSATPLETFYDAGTQVTLTAYPSSGNSFFRWGGTENNYSNPYVVIMNSHKTAIGIIMDTTGFASFPFEASSKGFASVNSLGYPNGTTGGSGPERGIAFVTSSTQLVDLMYQRVDVDHTGNLPPLTVFIIGTLIPEPGVGLMIDVKDAYDISIIGVGSDAAFSGVGLKIVRSSNIIVRNILFMNSPDDGISVQANDDAATGNHIWIDHCSITNCYDGALDVTHTPSYVTLSWNHFYNHDKTCLMGHSDSQVTDTAMKVTYHHNFFDGTRQRHPRIRFGKAHIFNNYYLGNPSTLYGVSSNLNAQAMVEGNYFNNVPIPTEISRDGSPPGNLAEQNNIFINCGTPGTGGTVFDPLEFYSYSVDSPADVPGLLMEYSGSGKYDYSLEDSLTAVPDELISFAAEPISSIQINLLFIPNLNNDNVVIVWNNTGSFTAPSGTPPSVGNPFAGGTLLYNGITSPYLHSGLTPSTDYFYKAFSYNGSGYSTGLTDNATTFEPSTTFQLSVSVTDGWNMTSVPGINPAGQGVDNWWINHTGAVYKFIPGSGYSGIIITSPGEGYWMKNTGDNVYNTGDEWPEEGIEIVAHNPIAVMEGWNMFGGYENAADVAALTTTPEDQILLPIYKYIPGMGYQTASTLEPGYGYWVKVSSDCQINIPNMMVKNIDKVVNNFKDDLHDAKAGWGRIILTDAAEHNYTLYAVNEKVDLTQYELPPLPPSGLFDFRFSSGRIAENVNSAIQYIEMRGVTYPVKIKVENLNIRLQDITGKEINAYVHSGNEIIINDAAINKLMVSGDSNPGGYVLEQNYPNPFNPLTKITFMLAESGMTKLIVYNSLGQKVETLVEEELPAGSHQAVFDASNLSSGVYFYRLESGKYSEVKKMMILK